MIFCCVVAIKFFVLIQNHLEDILKIVKPLNNYLFYVKI